MREFTATEMYDACKAMTDAELQSSWAVARRVFALEIGDHASRLRPIMAAEMTSRGMWPLELRSTRCVRR